MVWTEIYGVELRSKTCKTFSISWSELVYPVIGIYAWRSMMTTAAQLESAGMLSGLIAEQDPTRSRSYTCSPWKDFEHCLAAVNCKSHDSVFDSTTASR